jgi:energy-coupling factor transporter ATP-binding protein EcfA2
LDKNIFMLSTGSKRKLYLAAAFASGAALTLLDTPFAALDKVSIRFALTLLAEAAQDNTRLWVLADYAQPDGMTLPTLIDLGD